ncbi:hypothetical protein PGTUg99_022422 [Puccinia graminis f. sp. tritici]|nr:hypothetical protein PGTUg99_022422 [Puccinia graminis f. sp. tritici]
MLAGWSIISDQPNIHALPDVPLTANFSSTIGFGRNDTNNGGAMGISEIYNPVSVEEFVHNSNETHSSGDNTRIDSRSPSGFGATSSDGQDNNKNGYSHYHREVGVFSLGGASQVKTHNMVRRGKIRCQWF